MLLYTFKSNETPVVVVETLEGNQIGEYFGATVEAGDINGDGYDDLMVGAPFHGTIYNEGRIYIYLGNRQVWYKYMYIVLIERYTL